MAVDPVPANPPAPAAGNSGSYSLAFYGAWLNAALGVVCGALAGAYLLVHPSWLTSDVASTAGVIVTVTVGLAAILPSVGRTPGSREIKYLAASQGVLPSDIARKFPLVIAAPDPIPTTPKVSALP